MKQISFNIFPERERICVSHYPLPFSSPAIDTIDELMNLDAPDSRHRRKVIYIHIPFCENICTFCPFNKYLKDEKLIMAFIQSLKKEIKLYSLTKFAKTSIFESIYLGGGTPSCLKSSEIIEIINSIYEHFCISDDAMIFVEGNPMSFSYEKLASLHKYGVNRISVGVQTFSSKLAKNLSLINSPKASIQMINNAHSVGINNVGIDLMYPLPGMTQKDWFKTIDLSIKLKIEHICLIAFCVIPNSIISHQINNGVIPEPSGTEEEIRMYIKAREMLLNAGYIQYSILDFCLPGKEDKHAEIYFSDQGELLAFGPAAFGYINGYMYINQGDITEYINFLANGKKPIIVGTLANKEEEMRGMMAKGLRMLSVSKEKFHSLFDDEICNVFPKQIQSLIERDLIYETEDQISLTENGIIWGNNVCQEFFSENCKKHSIERKKLARGKIN